ncbi:DUF5776 domain-containing protein [Nicoliella lavandulae]|uniref:DUF5776 domain-containing protein n=1 Tax=Nicoliella lavandulae TaxID=3082954 RepID=A0ABU8SLW0_9LACO
MKKLLMIGLTVATLGLGSELAVNAKAQLQVRVISNIKAYNGKTFKQARVAAHYKVGQRLSITKIVGTGGMTRFELTNGHYILHHSK